MQKTFSIKTLGCKLNQYESSLIAGQFLDNGWISKPFGSKVDLVIVNTCTVTNKSDKKCRNYIRQAAAFAGQENVLVTGCLAERDRDGINSMPGVFTVAGNAEKENIYRIVKKHFDKLSASAYTEKETNKPAQNNNIKDSDQKDFPLPFYRTRGLIKIQDGCDGECTYCIVPNVRGKPVSRDSNDILTHAGKLIDSGCPEIILTGITIGKYNYGNKSLSDLVEDLLKINGEFRIRISSIEPKHVTEAFIDLFNNVELCQHIHLPLQSGSDIILQRMKRPYTVSEYMKLIENIKKINNDIAIGTDIIIGFPGETEEDFRQSLRIIEDVQFSYVHQFSFSARSGTPASEMHGCSSQEITHRSERMRKLASETGLNYRKKFTGQNLLSIIEKNRGNEGYTAITGNYIKMAINESYIESDKPGKLISVRLVSTNKNESLGMLL